MEIGSVIIIAVVVFFIGLLIGFLLSKATGKNDTAGNIKNQMDSLQERFVNYQKEVATHFNTTANLANKLSQNYQEIQTHLVGSVEALVTDADLRTKLLAEIQTDTTKVLDHAIATDLSKEDDNKNIPTVTTYNEVPRDYAPKGPGEPGTLAEDFGVKHK